jgi:hypothetical protein
MTLKKAIKKWRNIAHYGGTDEGAEDCALCLKFVRNHCEGCPVCIDKRIPGCRHTPYMDWCMDVLGRRDRKVFNTLSQHHANQMLAYLEGLLKKKLREKIMDKTKVVVMKLQPKTIQKVEYLKEVLKLKNKTSIVSLAIATLDLLVKVETGKGRVVLEYKDGTREKITFT